MSLNQFEQLFPSAITEAKPDYFRWMTVKKAALLKIGIFGDNSEVVCPGVFPNFSIGETS